MSDQVMNTVLLTREEELELGAMGLFQDDPRIVSQREIDNLSRKQYSRMVEIATMAAMRELMGNDTIH